VSFEIKHGIIEKIELVPISLGFEQRRAGKGMPKFADKEHSVSVLQELNDLSSELVHLLPCSFLPRFTAE
jgi:hypothetical protein